MILRLILLMLVASAFIAKADAQLNMQELDDPLERWYVTKAPVPKDFEANPLKYHPNLGYKHADELFKAGEKERAVYWMYQSQLRYRILLDCFDKKAWDTDYDTFVALRYDVDAEQNAWLGGDLQLWLDTLDAVAAGYDRKKDVLVKKKKCKASAEGVLDGLEKMRAMLLSDYESVRAQRAEAGLENRTDGPLIDKRAETAN